MNTFFDTHVYVRRMIDAGVPEPQAEVHAETLARVLKDCTVSPAGLDRLKRELLAHIDEVAARLRADFKADLEALRHELGQRIDGLGQRTDRLGQRITRVDEGIHYLKWMNALTLALVLGLYAKSWL